MNYLGNIKNKIKNKLPPSITHVGWVGDSTPLNIQIDVGEPVNEKPVLHEYDTVAPAAMIPEGVATPLLNPGFVQTKNRMLKVCLKLTDV